LTADANTTVPITACDNGSYCCGGNNLVCCNATEGVWIVNNQISLTKPVSLSSSSTTSTTATASPTTSSSQSSPATQQQQNNGLSGGAKAGIGVGAALGVLALLGVGAFILWKRRKGLKNYETKDGPSQVLQHVEKKEEPAPEYPQELNVSALENNQKLELSAHKNVQELMGSHDNTHELDGRGERVEIG